MQTHLQNKASEKETSNPDADIFLHSLNYVWKEEITFSLRLFFSSGPINFYSWLDTKSVRNAPVFFANKQKAATTF